MNILKYFLERRMKKLFYEIEVKKELINIYEDRRVAAIAEQDNMVKKKILEQENIKKIKREITLLKQLVK